MLTKTQLNVGYSKKYVHILYHYFVMNSGMFDLFENLLRTQSNQSSITYDGKKKSLLPTVLIISRHKPRFILEENSVYAEIKWIHISISGTTDIRTH